MNGKTEKEKQFRRFIHNLYTKEEAETFFRDIHDSRNEVALGSVFSELKDEAECRPSPNDITYHQYKEEARRLLRNMEKEKRPRIRRIAMSVAAVASALLLGIFIFQYVKDAQNASGLYVETVTPSGEREQFTLSDSTRVVLNSRTNIAYPEQFGKNERRVRLSGEAYFDVSKDKKPFIIETARFNIRVLGTAFNVKAYEEDETVSVSVNEGRVEVSMSDATFTLTRNEKVTLNSRTGEIMKEISRNNASSFAWMKGWLYFNHTPIRDVARELERVYGCRIVFDDGQEFNNLISGEHDNKSLESVLQSIQYTTKIKYKKDGNDILFFK